MSTEDHKITQKSIDGATEIIKAMLNTPNPLMFFGSSAKTSSRQRLINAHGAIAQHLSNLENRANSDAANLGKSS